MDLIAYQNKCMQAVTKATHPLPEQYIEALPFLVITEERLSRVTAQHYVVHRAREWTLGLLAMTQD